MTSTIKPFAPSGLAILPIKRPGRQNYLDAAAALDLAVLGATGSRMTPLGRLDDTIWCITGGGWRPPAEIILEALRAATAAGTIRATDAWVRSTPFYYSLTPKGALAFQSLMRIPLPAWDDLISRSGAAIKFGLLDVVDTADLAIVAADLERFYRDARAGLEDRRDSLAADRVYLHKAVGDRIAWADQRLYASEDLLDRRNRGKVIH